MLLILLECLACFLIWWRGVAVALGDRPERRNWDRLQRQRRADWVRNELEQRPWLWLALGLLMTMVLADWFADKWEPPWRAAILWRVGMSVVLVVVVALAEHFGWGLTPTKV